MRRIHDLGVEVWGFDFASEMVEKAKENLRSVKLERRVWQGDVTDPAAFHPRGVSCPGAWEVCVATGVFPHLTDERAALRNMAAALRPGGRVLIEFRNDLFSLFSLNRYSYQFFCERLVQFQDLKRRHPEYQGQLEEIESELAGFFRTDQPPLRPGSEGAPSFDEVLAQFHHQEEIGPLFTECGFEVVGQYFYHFHAVPPLFEKKHPELFRTLSLEMEGQAPNPRDRWMASAYVVEAILRKSR